MILFDKGRVNVMLDPLCPDACVSRQNESESGKGLPSQVQSVHFCTKFAKAHALFLRGRSLLAAVSVSRIFAHALLESQAGGGGCIREFAKCIGKWRQRCCTTNYSRQKTLQSWTAAGEGKSAEMTHPIEGLAKCTFSITKAIHHVASSPTHNKPRTARLR